MWHAVVTSEPLLHRKWQSKWIVALLLYKGLVIHLSDMTAHTIENR